MWEKDKAKCNYKTCKCVKTDPETGKQIPDMAASLVCQMEKAGNDTGKAFSEVAKIVGWLAKHWWLSLIGGALVVFSIVMYKTGGFGKMKEGVDYFRNTYNKVRDAVKDFEAKENAMREARDEMREKARKATDPDQKTAFEEAATELDAMLPKINDMALRAADVVVTKAAASEIKRVLDARAAVDRAEISVRQAREQAGRVNDVFSNPASTAEERSSAIDELKRGISEANEAINAAEARFTTPIE